MNNRALLRQFEAWRGAGADLVLATVVETAGSTYSKAGRHLLIGPDNNYAGLVGGGCLEGDLLLQAEEVRATGIACLLTYDMRDDADDLWGIGLGCRGLMRLLLQPLLANDGWQPFAAIAAAMAATTATPAALVIASDTPEHPIGELQLGAAALAPAGGAGTSSALQAHSTGSGAFTTLHWPINPWPRLLVLGAGPDAAPVLVFAQALGWQVCMVDHRPALLQAPTLESADERHCLIAGNLTETLELADFDAVLIMSHHLQTDLQYVHQVALYEHAYVGVLGPAARRMELLAQLDLQDSDFATRLRGPVGFDIGADSPEAIAIAVVAEIHATLKQRSDDKLSANLVE